MSAPTSRSDALLALKQRRLTETARAADTECSGSPSSTAAGAGGERSSAAAATASAAAPPPAVRSVLGLAWLCSVCQSECVPIRSESRCLCGHRLKEHDKPGGPDDHGRCKATRCACRGFFYILAEGAWVLRCRCKHKHVEHDAATHACKKAGCGCGVFDSPFVCNCDHSWGEHKQVVLSRQVRTFEEMAAAAAQGQAIPELDNPVPEMNQIKRGL